MDKEKKCGICMCVCNGILLSHKKKNKILPFATTMMALEGITPSEIRQEKNKSCMISLTESKTKQNKKKQAHG